MLKGAGSASTTTQVQLLDPNDVFEAEDFYYDFYVKGTTADAVAVWQRDYQTYYFTDIPGASGISGNTGTGSQEWVKDVSVGSDSAGLFQISVDAGTVDYFYSLNGRGHYPTTRASEGATSSSVEFYVEPGRIYTVTSDGTHEWQYYDGSGWAAFSEGTESGFTFDAPPTRRIKLVPTGTVNFNFKSRKP
tara:strand:+ start:2585 stop:3154 length:570 start_codon:yes stop_codon:yes gene_type:complete